MMEVNDLVCQYETFQEYTESARALSERDWDYDNHHQWTDEEIATLDLRGQAAVVINRIKTKVNLLTGIQRKSRSQPRALARTPQHEDAADAATEALRFVVDNTDFEMTSSAVFRDEMVVGYGGAIVEMDGKDIAIRKIPWDRYYYDPHSRELDFADKKYDGIVAWMDEEDIIQMFPKKEEDIRHLLTADDTGSDTFDDKPNHWVDTKRKRMRICQHFYKYNGVWMMCFFTNYTYLMEPQESPFKDEYGRPQNPIEMQTAYIDRELQRYGEVRSYIWLQDEINHRRSRLLYAGSVTRTMGEEGAVDDVNELKQELAKADGHIKYNKGFDFQVLPNDAISETQLLLYRESKQEIDELGANAALAGKGNSRSGRQDQIQQQAGIAELASLYDGHKHWEKRIYRQVWNRIRQSWTAEKWIRVTDDKTNLQWVGLNIPVTNGQLLEESDSPEAPNVLQSMLSQQDPRLNEVAMVRNNVAEMEVDITITHAPDTHTLRQEQFDTLMGLAERYGPENVPFVAALELSDMPNKAETKKLLNIEPPSPEEMQMQMEAQKAQHELMIAEKKAEIAAKQAKAQKDMAQAQALMLENAAREAMLEPNAVADLQKKQLDNAQKEIETYKLATEPTQSVSVNT